MISFIYSNAFICIESARVVSRTAMAVAFSVDGSTESHSITRESRTHDEYSNYRRRSSPSSLSFSLLAPIRHHPFLASFFPSSLFLPSYFFAPLYLSIHPLSLSSFYPFFFWSPSHSPTPAPPSSISWVVFWQVQSGAVCVLKPTTRAHMQLPSSSSSSSSSSLSLTIRSLFKREKSLLPLRRGYERKGTG